MLKHPKMTTSNSLTSSKLSPQPFSLTHTLGPLHRVKLGTLPTPDRQPRISRFQPAGLDQPFELKIKLHFYKCEGYMLQPYHFRET